MAMGVGLVAGCSSNPDRAPVESARTAPSDQERIQGSWVVTYAVFVGFPAPLDKLQESNLTYVFAKDTIEMREGDPPKTTKKARYRLDPTRSPKAVDFLDPETNKVNAVGIYKLDGETLWLHFFPSADEKNRPDNFKRRIKEPLTLLAARRSRP